MIVFKNTPLFFAFFLIPIAFVQSATVEYGEECNFTDKLCNTTAFIECNKLTSTCTCVNPEKSKYDESKKSCGINLHETCSNDIGAQKCMLYSTCTDFGQGPKKVLTCECLEPTFTESGTRGKCVLAQGITCSVLPIAELCNVQPLMHCEVGGKCDCLQDPKNETIYQKSTKSCVRLQGAECKLGLDKISCVEKANCVIGNSGKSFSCQCENNKGRKWDGKCVVQYGEECGSAAMYGMCREEDFLECSGDPGKCRCKGTNTWYDSPKGKCTLLAGAQCKLTGQPCVTNSYCPSDEGVCTCAPGLTRTKDGQCVLKYGDKCNGQPRLWECDPGSFLECDFLESETCHCANSYRTIFEDRVCKLKALSTCVPNTPSAQQCMNDTECKLGGSSWSSCICKEPLFPSKSNLCVRNYNMTCGADLKGSCDSEAFLECTENGRCDCKSPSRMDPKTNLCSVGMNGSCSPDKNSLPCDDTLTCISGKCVCDASAGLEDNGYGRCAKLYGASCNVYDDSHREGFCDWEDHYLTCSNGECVCNESHRVKEGGLPCVGNLNAACKTDENCNSQNSFVCDVKLQKCVKSGGDRLSLNFVVSLAAAVIVASLNYIN